MHCRLWQRICVDGLSDEAEEAGIERQLKVGQLKHWQSFQPVRAADDWVLTTPLVQYRIYFDNLQFFIATRAGTVLFSYSPMIYRDRVHLNRSCKQLKWLGLGCVAGFIQADSKNHHSKDKSGRHKNEGTISLQPSKRRTQGKKSLITSKCSLL